MIAPNFRARKGGSEGGVWKNLRGRGGECRLWRNGSSQSATCVKGVEWGLGTRGLRIMAVFSAGIPVSLA